MQEKGKLLIALNNELKEGYEYYLETEYNENAHFDINPDHDPDFVEWTEKNCLKYAEWVTEYADDKFNEILNLILEMAEGLKQ